MPDLENLLNIEDEVTQALSDLGVTAKINEMDDFMNQNDLKVSITNENTAVTGLVTYTCTVKDADNNALANRVVEWYEGTTLVGLDATNSSGVSTFTKRVTPGNVYDVHAVVRGTHAGDDIRMFVKDKQNKITTNLWSGTDYNGSVSHEQSSTTYFNGSSGLDNLESSGDWSTIGDKCLKQTYAQGSYCEFVLDDIDPTKTYVAKVDVLSAVSGSLLLVAKNTTSSTSSMQSVNFNSSSSVQHVTVSISGSDLEDKDQLRMRLRNLADGVIFSDNWELLES